MNTEVNTDGSVAQRHRGLILLTDVGSTTTKAVLLGRPDPAGPYRLLARADAATTVEAPYEDVIVGVRRAVAEVARRAGRGEFLTPGPDGAVLARDRIGLYLSTSSAGGGLQVMVCGVMRRLTARSAEQAALGAGAIVLDVLAVDDERTPLQRFRAISAARPDMVLVAGGMEGGTPRFILETCDFLNLSEMRPRFGQRYRLPIVFAGAENVKELVAEMLGRRYHVLLAPNLRPDLLSENLDPVRHAIMEIFESHVMAQAPGYERLTRWVDGPVLPTPVGVARILDLFSRKEAANVLCLDLGGATTDVFSLVNAHLTRSVSANLGVSYSATNVLALAGAARMAGWLPYTTDEDGLRNQVGNKTLHPTTIPETPHELLAEQALATEAIRLAVEQHLAICTPPSGPREVAFGRQRDLAAQADRSRRVELAELEPGLVIGSGGLLASAPRRAQAALILLNSVRPGGLFRLYVDSVFMLPHLGVLAEVQPETALAVLESDCLVALGTVAQLKSPPGQRPGADRSRPTRVTARLAENTTGAGAAEIVVEQGDIGVLPLPPGATGLLTVLPGSGQDFGAGKGATLTAEVSGGEVGVIIDNRRSPAWEMAEWPGPERAAQVRRWFDALGALPGSMKGEKA
jgi:uncharacterized protein (TIGR01319 family)